MVSCVFFLFFIFRFCFCFLLLFEDKLLESFTASFATLANHVCGIESYYHFPTDINKIFFLKAHCYTHLKEVLLHLTST